MLRILTLSVSFLAAQSAAGQNWFFNKTDVTQDSLPVKSFLQLRYQLGGIADTKTAGVHYIDSNPFQSVDVRYGVYGYGRKKWHQLHHYPTYGIGISKFMFQPKDNILGNPFTTYLFFNESVFKFKKSSVGYDFSVGLAYHWKPYDQYTNPEQKVIGSPVTAYVAMGVQYDFKFSDRFDATLGISINHFSNGRIRSPNRGLNLYALNSSLRYRLGPVRPAHKSKDISFKESKQVTYVLDSFRPMIEFYTVASAGAVTTFQDINNRSLYYLAASGSIDVARHYRPSGKYGLGFDWSYDESLKVVYQNDYPSGAVPSYLLNWPGVHLSHEYLIHRWTFITQAGINLKVVGDKGIGYGRIALRYDLTKSIFLRVGVRVHHSVTSDFIEWGAGYSYYKMKTGK